MVMVYKLREWSWKKLNKVFIDREFYPLTEQLDKHGIKHTFTESEKADCNFFVYFVNHSKEFLECGRDFVYDEDTLPLDLGNLAALFAEMTYMSNQMPKSTFVVCTEEGEKQYEAAVALIHALGVKVFSPSEIGDLANRIAVFSKVLDDINKEEDDIDTDQEN